MQLERRTRSEVFAPGLAIAGWHYVVTEPVPPHVHDFIELAVVTAGAGLHTRAEGTSRLVAGDVVVVRPGAWHAYAPEAGPEPFEVTNAYIGPETVHGELAWLLDCPPLARLVLMGGQLAEPLPAGPRCRVAGWLGQLAQEQRRPDRLLNAALLQCALAEISRTAEEQVGVPPPGLSRAVREVLQAMTDDLARSWSVTELAARPGLSTSALHRQFRDQLGSGPIDWLTLARAETAATLLVQTDLPVAAVGRRVGWSDPSYARRRFFLVHALSPTAYRQAHAARTSGDAV